MAVLGLLVFTPSMATPEIERSGADLVRPAGPILKATAPEQTLPASAARSGGA